MKILSELQNLQAQVRKNELRVALLKERVSLFKYGSVISILVPVFSILSPVLYYLSPGNALWILPLLSAIVLFTIHVGSTQVHIIHTLDEIRNLIETKKDEPS